MTSLEISKQLFEVSGWESSDWWYERTDPKSLVELRTLGRPDIGFVVDKYDVLAPVYTSDYLFEKLPAYIGTYDEHADDYLLKVQPSFEGNEWEAAYWGLERALYWDRADTPADALALLAILLIKEGIIEV